MVYKNYTVPHFLSAFNSKLTTLMYEIYTDARNLTLFLPATGLPHRPEALCLRASFFWHDICSVIF